MAWSTSGLSGILDAEEAAYCPDGWAHNGKNVLDYDYDSIMHYDAYAFSANGQPTIEPLDPDAVIGQRSGLSAGDIQAAHYLYSFTPAQWDTDFCQGHLVFLFAPSPWPGRGLG